MPSIIPEADQIPAVAARLLKAADEVGADPATITTDTSGSGLAFVVSDDIAAAAGFGTGDEEIEPDEADEPPALLGEDETGAPPRDGDGSGRDAWREFLTSKGIEWDQSRTRNQLIAIWDAARGAAE